MASVQAAKRKLATVSLVNKYKALKEIDSGQTCVATARKYGVAKNTISYWVKKNNEIFEAVEQNNVSKRRKRIKGAKHEDLDTAMYKWLKTA